LRSNAVTETFQAAQTRRSHMKSGLRALSGVVTLHTVTRGSPHGLQVTKTQGMLAMDKWSSRVESARAFLARIGTPDELARIMGGREFTGPWSKEQADRHVAGRRATLVSTVEHQNSIRRGETPTQQTGSTSVRSQQLKDDIPASARSSAASAARREAQHPKYNCATDDHCPVGDPYGCRDYNPWRLGYHAIEITPIIKTTATGYKSDYREDVDRLGRNYNHVQL